MRRSLPLLIALVCFCLLFSALVIVFPALASQQYGPPAATLSLWGRVAYSVRLLWDDGLLVSPRDPNGAQLTFHIEQNETVDSIAQRLQNQGLINSASAFRDYLVYMGLDTGIQAGDYDLSPALSIVDIAHRLQDATPEDVTFVVLPGWRMEEIAASLPTSGLSATPDEFLAAAASTDHFDFLQDAASTEGFFFPDTYILPRVTDAGQLVDAMRRDFALHLTNDLRDSFVRHGLSVYQAVTLASIVQREAVHEQEQPIIASVFYNRLNSGMNLGSDPTVQYALGYNALQGSWWTNPLSAQDLQFDSLYNTYIYSGLPPGPIANPGLSALRAVAFPADTQYYFFRARCDDSGYHVFAETFEQHLQNACP